MPGPGCRKYTAPWLWGLEAWRVGAGVTDRGLKVWMPRCGLESNHALQTGLCYAIVRPAHGPSGTKHLLQNPEIQSLETGEGNSAKVHVYAAGAKKATTTTLMGMTGLIELSLHVSPPSLFGEGMHFPMA